jgi:hypothetical protein
MTAMTMTTVRPFAGGAPARARERAHDVALRQQHCADTVAAAATEAAAATAASPSTAAASAVAAAAAAVAAAAAAAAPSGGGMRGGERGSGGGGAGGGAGGRGRGKTRIAESDDDVERAACGAADGLEEGVDGATGAAG